MQHDFREAGFLHVALVSRQGHGGQNTDDRDNDHQFDQGETLLDRTLHDKLLVKKWGTHALKQLLCQKIGSVLEGIDAVRTGGKPPRCRIL
ncbi:hypothetical protein D3C80_2058120 [compost metagenome]